MRNSIEFYKGILLHVIPVRIIAPWLYTIAKVVVLIISSTTAVEVATSLLLEIKYWPEMKTKEKRDNNSKSNAKQTKTKKNSIIHDNIKMVQIL